MTQNNNSSSSTSSSSSILYPTSLNNKSYGSIITDTQEIDKKTASKIDPDVQKRLLRKLDLRLTLWAFLASICNYLDRNNLQNAFTLGMDKDLDLDSSVFNWSMTIFFIGYTIMQIPGNIVITKISPSWALPTFVIVWSFFVCLTALVQDYKQLWILRFCLGLMEAPLYPGAIFLLGSWYNKEELGKRVMFYAAGTILSGAVGGFIAGGIYNTMHGVGNLPAWKWLFVIEGLIGIFVGLLGFLTLPNFPHNTSWLTPEERKVALLRVQNQGISVTSYKYSWGTLRNVLATPYLWLMMINFGCIILSQSLPVQFFVIILRDIGFSAESANYMQIPLNLFAAIIGMLIGWSSDRHKNRAFHIAGPLLFAGIWYMILAVVNNGDNPVVFVIIGAFAISVNTTMVSLSMAWLSELFNATDYNSKGIAISLANMVGILYPNFISIKFWVVTDSPVFWAGKMSSMVASFISVIAVIVIWFLLRIDYMTPKKKSNELTVKMKKNDDGTEDI